MTASAFISATHALNIPEATPALADKLRAEGESAVLEIEETRTRISQLKDQLEGLWRGETRSEYVLTSVFVHRGASPSFGHYFIYQRRMPRKIDEEDVWFKYNDSDVSVVSADEVFADTTGSTANPYLVRLSLCL